MSSILAESQLKKHGRQGKIGGHQDSAAAVHSLLCSRRHVVKSNCKSQSFFKEVYHAQ